MTLSFFALLIGGIIPPQPTGYYLSATGSDSNAGTSPSAPWQTISKLNAVGLTKGDSVYFHGGDTFSGNLLVTPAIQPDASHPITITSYGTGSATISAGTVYGIRAVDCGYIHISNLTITGPGFTNSGGTITPGSTAGAVEFTYSTASTTFNSVSLQNCTFTGTGHGITIFNSNTAATACLDGITISGNTMNTVPGFPVFIRGVGPSGDLPGQIFSNVVIDSNSMDDNPGYGASGGVPIVLYNATSPVISRNYCNNNGYGSNTGSPVSMLFVNSTNGWVHHNEISNFTSASGNDGHGIDPDNGCTDFIVEYNYCHDSNRYGLYNFAGVRTVWRYNIVERCLGAVVFVSGSMQVYQNSFYSTASGHPVVNSFGTDKIYNNIIIGPSGTKLIDCGSSTEMIGNSYGTTNNDGSFLVTVNGTSYTSLSAFRTAGFEKVSSTNYGAVGNPQFTAPGAGTQQLTANPVSHLAAYDIGSSSAARAVGVDLSSRSITPPTTDWHGNPASTGTNPDAGAVAFGSH